MVLRELFCRLSAYEQGDQQLSDPVPLEVDLDCDSRTRAVVEWLDGAPANGPDRTVDAPKGKSRRRRVLRPIHGGIVQSKGIGSFTRS